MHLIFNGDIVDRGPDGLEVLMFIAALIVRLTNAPLPPPLPPPHPRPTTQVCFGSKYVHLVRGNHESKWQTSTYTFKEEV